MVDAGTPFKISISDDALVLLKKKLELSVFPDELESSGRKYGAPLADIRRLSSRWQNGFDWRKEEAKLNEELPQFTTDIQVEAHGTLNIHYVHKRSEVSTAIPLLFIHGWPGSFIEVRKILPLLTASSPDGPTFHVVALSLPGYGFSEAPSTQGFALPQYAEVGHKLMLSLGYDKYVTQGGDWGGLITLTMASMYGGKGDMAWHTNMPIGQPPKLLTNPLMYLSHLITPYTTREIDGMKRYALFRQSGSGYSQEQGTQPQTLGYSLADSPVGLLAWIYEKLVNWTDDYPWEDDEVLTWISIYWFSRAGPTASLRIYFETKVGNLGAPLPVSTIPLGISLFPKELIVMPTRFYKTRSNLVFTGTHDSGGHFAAHEKPNELVGDLRKMFGRGGPAFGVVSTLNGYAKL